jgi:hypothetical protein
VDGESDDLCILLQGRVDDHLRGLPQSRVDDLVAGVTERTSNHLDAAVVSVEPDLGDDDPHGTHSSWSHCF